MTKGRRRMYSTVNDRVNDTDLFPETIERDGITFRKKPSRYGDNPHQAAATYTRDGDNLITSDYKELKTGKSGLSVTNLRDIDRAYRMLAHFRDVPACAVMKHLNPAGLARSTKYNQRNLRECFIDAWEGDSIAAFGSVDAFTEAVDKDTANEIQNGTRYVEVVAAPDFEEGVMDIFENTTINRGDKDKKVNPNIRIVQIPNIDKLPRYEGEDTYGFLETIYLADGSFILQEPYLSQIRDRDDLKAVTEREPTEREYDDLLFAWRVCEGVRSNGVVIANRGKVLAAGTGQQERAYAIRMAAEKVYEKGHADDFNEAVLASDGFMLFDNLDPFKEGEITAIIQPGGSISDKKLIKTCNERGIAMILTGSRCFGHF
ncbi:MAG: IMP cyclohydrolase [Nanoarchaeota archaeon]|nr:IMP cyclohydrolase [Nanoarchaeota archaeon]MBU2519681.1 IMP cyclohydrolase [Nanoarchaeota archaeon]